MKRPIIEKRNGTVSVTLTFMDKDARAISESAKAVRMDEGDYLLAAYAFAGSTAVNGSGLDARNDEEHQKGIVEFVEENREKITDYDD